jgi:hypothetical protein
MTYIYNLYPYIYATTEVYKKVYILVYLVLSQTLLIKQYERNTGFF